MSKSFAARAAAAAALAAVQFIVVPLAKAQDATIERTKLTDA